jgi:fatty acid-binding protein DegV
MKIGFVTDSTSDIPAHLAEQHGIEIVPVLVNIGGKSSNPGNTSSFVDQSMGRGTAPLHLPEH